MLYSIEKKIKFLDHNVFIQNKYEMANTNEGKKKKITEFMCTGNFISLKNNFSASAINCSRPLYPIKFGPTLRWIKLKYFRSINGIIPAINVKFIKQIKKKINVYNIFTLIKFIIFIKSCTI